MVHPAHVVEAVHAAAGDVDIVRVVPLEGGSSATVDRVDLVDRSGSEHRLVVRLHADRAVKEHGHEVAATEFALLGVVGRLGVPVPAPLALHPPGGEPWLVMEWVDGSSATDEPVAVVDRMADLLAELHDLGEEIRQVPGLVGLEDPTAGLRAFLPDDAHGRALAAVLDVGVSRRPNPDVVVHNDYWPGNVLVAGGEIAAVIDWEDAAVGDPLADLAGASIELACSHGEDAADRFVARYRRRRRIDLHDLPLWEAYSSAAALASMHRWGLDAADEAARRATTRGRFERAAASVRSAHGRAPAAVNGEITAVPDDLPR